MIQFLFSSHSFYYERRMRAPHNVRVLAGEAASPTLQIYHPVSLSISFLPSTSAHRKMQDTVSFLKGPEMYPTTGRLFFPSLGC